MITFRRITEDDVPRVRDLALQALDRVAADLPINVSRDRVEAQVQMFARDHAHFQMAAFDEHGYPVAAIAVAVSAMPFFERQEGYVYFWYSTAPGAGMKLGREMKKWFDNNFMVRRLSWALNEGADYAPLIRRLGFKRELPLLVCYKGD